MAQCIKCGKDVPEGGLFCPFCGKRQQAPPRKHKKRANGTGNIFKLSGNRSRPYAARKNEILIGTYKTYVEAQKALDRLTDEDVNDKFNLTFAEVFERWKPQHFREVSPEQQGNYESAFKHAQPLHDLKFRNIRKSEYAAIIMGMESRGYSKSSCEKVLQLFGQLSKWAYDECIISRIYSDNLRTVATQKKEGKPYTAEQLGKIQQCKLKGADVLRILIATGCRPKDLFTAQLSDCHGDYFISGSKTEAGYDRAIAVSDYGLADYQAMVLAATISGGTKLIDGHTGEHVYENYRRREYAAIKRELGLGDRTPYSARHTYTTAAFASGMPQELMKRQLGHEDIRTTDKIYNHADKDKIVAAGRAVQFTVDNIGLHK